jgi:hypothetical protein
LYPYQFVFSERSLCHLVINFVSVVSELYSYADVLLYVAFDHVLLELLLAELWHPLEHRAKVDRP